MDIIDHVEQLAANAGSNGVIDEGFFDEFVNLSDSDIEKLVLGLMVDQASEVCRIANTSPEGAGATNVVQFVLRGIKIMSTGLMMFGRFGGLGFYARTGEAPSEMIQDAVESRIVKAVPIIEDAVDRYLPWILSKPHSF